MLLVVYINSYLSIYLSRERERGGGNLNAFGNLSIYLSRKRVRERFECF